MLRAQVGERVVRRIRMDFGYLQEGQAVLGTVIGDKRFFEMGSQKKTALTEGGDYPGIFTHGNVFVIGRFEGRWI
jgi:hypothetical protein